MRLGSREIEPEGKQLPPLLVIDVEGPPGPVHTLDTVIGQHLLCRPEGHLEGGLRIPQFDTLLIRINLVAGP